MGLTLVALGLRLYTVSDSLFGDELFLFRIVHDHGLGSVLTTVRETEKTPPLHFFLAWAAAQLGDPTYWVRAPSIVFGTATVPLVYVLGARTVGRPAGLIGAALVTLDPFAIFYSVESRAYSTIAFLTALSTLALLVALETGRRSRWAAYGVACLAVLLTHYVAAIVVAAQAIWAILARRDRRREIVLVHAAVLVAYLPWIPSFVVQFRNSADEARRIAAQAPLTIDRVGDIQLRAVFGHPFIPLRELPGAWAVAIGVAVVVLAAGVAIVRRRGDPRRALLTPVGLILVLAVATPVGIAVYSLQPDTSFLLPRNLSPSLPAAALSVGWLLALLDGPWRVAATSAVLAVGLLGAVQMLRAENRRPAYREVARFIDAHAGRRDPVANFSFSERSVPIGQVLQVHLRRPHPIFQGDATGREVWRLGARSGRVFVVLPQVGPFEDVRHLPRLNGPHRGFVLRRERHYPGLADLLVAEYAKRGAGARR